MTVVSMPKRDLRKASRGLSNTNLLLTITIAVFFAIAGHR